MVSKIDDQKAALRALFGQVRLSFAPALLSEECAERTGRLKD